MDKRLFPIVGLTFLGTGCYLLLVAFFLGAYAVLPILLGVMIPVMLFIFWLSLLAMAGALWDGKRRLDVTDDRFFLRIFLYKTACIPFFAINFAFWLILSLGAANPFLFWAYIFVPAAVLFALVLMLASSYQVIAGLAETVRKGEMKKVEFVLHIVLQHIFVVDVIDALFLMIKEKKRRPKVKIGLFSRAIAPRMMPAPGLMGTHVVFATFCMTIFSLFAIGSNTLAAEVPTTFVDMIGFWVCFFPWFSGVMITFCLLIGREIYDTVRFQQSIPLEVRERGFLRRLLFFSSAAFVLELLSAFLVAFIVWHLFSINPSDTSMVPTSCFAIAVLLSTILLLQSCAFFYTRLVVRRSLADAVISGEKAGRLTHASRIPGAQIASVIILMRCQ